MAGSINLPNQFYPPIFHVLPPSGVITPGLRNTALLDDLVDIPLHNTKAWSPNSISISHVASKKILLLFHQSNQIKSKSNVCTQLDYSMASNLLHSKNRCCIIQVQEPSISFIIMGKSTRSRSISKDHQRSSIQNSHGQCHC